ncbi:UNVERIFIED_CONTAM: hypothetical protein Sradi_5239900 [Sesamum radiatum]|uniref:Myb/SANT-like domain-containing protein n=1 Tax=Sesamum radiatum TaxID=300843 RepID=A0AAW2LKW4_SESRA
MTSTANNVVVVHRRTFGGQRTWTAREEELLVNGLKSIITSGWKSNNHFCNGYLLQLEGYMLNAFPNSDISTEPHINSKVYVWKKYYSTLVNMLKEK